MGNNNKIRRVRVWFNCNGKRAFVLGDFHPCVNSVYITERQANGLHKKHGCRAGDIYPEGNWGVVKVLGADGISRVWRHL